MVYDIRRFDIYRKVPKDLTQPTTTGAIISISSGLFILFLLVSEFLTFMRTDIVSELYVDDPTVGDKIPVNIRMSLPGIECKFLGIDIQDEHGRHEVGYLENTRKDPINGGKGCIFGGTFHVNKVPGNFHVSTHSSQVQPQNPDMNHEVHELFFGESMKGINSNLPANFIPLNGKKTSAEKMASHDYTLKVVPTVYQDIKKRTKFGYQFTAVYKDFVAFGHGHRVMPAIWFRYEVSPITVKYTEKSKPLYHFLTTFCAIIGGTFTVAGMIDSMIFSAHQMVKKAGEGKLS